MNYGRNTRLLKYWLITAFKNAAAPLISIESESSEIEIVQQERVILFIITLMKDYLGLTVQYFTFNAIISCTGCLLMNATKVFIY